MQQQSGDTVVRELRAMQQQYSSCHIEVRGNGGSASLLMRCGRQLRGKYIVTHGRV